MVVKGFLLLKQAAGDFQLLALFNVPGKVFSLTCY